MNSKLYDEIPEVKDVVPLKSGDDDMYQNIENLLKLPPPKLKTFSPANQRRIIQNIYNNSNETFEDSKKLPIPHDNDCEIEHVTELKLSKNLRRDEKKFSHMKILTNHQASASKKIVGMKKEFVKQAIVYDDHIKQNCIQNSPYMNYRRRPKKLQSFSSREAAKVYGNENAKATIPEIRGRTRADKFRSKIQHTSNNNEMNDASNLNNESYSHSSNLIAPLYSTSSKLSEYHDLLRNLESGAMIQSLQKEYNESQKQLASSTGYLKKITKEFNSLMK